MRNVPRVQMPGKANSRAYVEATEYDWLVHEMEGLRRKLDEALLERDAMGADRDRLAAELHEARSERRREHDLRCRIASELEHVQAELAQARRRLDAWARHEWALNGPGSPLWKETVAFLGDAYTGYERDRATASARRALDELHQMDHEDSAEGKQS